MSDVISLMDMDLRFYYVSPSISRLTGFTVEEEMILGHTELAMLRTDKDHDLYSDLKEIQTAAKRSLAATWGMVTCVGPAQSGTLLDKMPLPVLWKILNIPISGDSMSNPHGSGQMAAHSKPQ